MNLDVTNRKAFGEFLRFCVVGTVSTAIDAGIYNLVLLVASYRVALVSGYCLSLVVNYLLTMYWTFRERPSLGNTMGVVGAHLFNLFVVRMSLMWLFADVMCMSERIAYWPTLAISVVTNFLILRWVVILTKSE
ncbi:MAG: GtrA family protein [Bacteroidaceae bacterium]|nr:GtrA family protein [Bacteroidaceae bacterium]